MTETQFEKISPVLENGESECPYCAREITGKDVMLLKDIAGFKDLIQWTISCPDCGQVVRKRAVSTLKRIG
jgi:C4-type Zn-finger protein